MSPARAFDIGEEIRRLRVERGLSQQELAERMGLPHSVIAHLEAGGAEPRLSTLDRVAEALGMKVKVELLAPDVDERSTS